MAHKTLDEDFQRALSVIFRTECEKNEQKQIVEEVVKYWKESVNPGTPLSDTTDLTLKAFWSTVSQ